MDMSKNLIYLFKFNKLNGFGTGFGTILGL